MKITALNIYNYKNLNIELNNSSSIIAIIGNNGSGKSNILEALSSIFFYLYNKRERDIPFNFKIEYTIGENQKVFIEKKNSSVKYKVNDADRSDALQVLPKQIIALYSGEEDRLWSKSYQPLYMAFISNINKSEITGLGDYAIVPRMLYINKFYWHISLLCLLLSDAPDTQKFCTETLGIHKINSIKLDFNTSNYANYGGSAIKSFISLIDGKSDYSINELKEIISDSPYTLDTVFKYLYLAFTPDKKKMLENITIKYNDENLDIEDFSEGEKKMLLIKSALEFAGLEDSLFLLDEPDAHIHLSNKIQIKNVFKEYLKTRQVILTTHSPTLTDTLDDDSLFMLSTGKLVPSKKQEILENVSGEFWNKFQQNAFISSKKPIILLVEGKHDKEHITNAYEALKDDFKSLDFEIFKLNTETNIQPFLRGLYESEFDDTKIYIGLFDREVKILNDFKNPKNYAKIDGKTFFKIIESDKPNTNYYVTALPELEDKKCDCSIEMMYEYSKWEEAYQKAVQNTLGKTANKSVKSYSEDVLNDAKNIMSENSKDFVKDDFKNFKTLFALILEIQSHKNELTKSIEIANTNKGLAHSELSASKDNSKLIKIYTTKRNTDVKAEFKNNPLKIIVKAGSRLSLNTVASYGSDLTLARKNTLNKISAKEGNHYKLLEDIEFTSPSGAINFATGGNMNGWDDWLLEENGKSLQSIRNKE